LVSLLVVLLVAVSVSSFAPVTFAPRASTSLDIFGGGKKKPAAADKKGGKDLNVFGGRGSKITVREDEDNAMWIEGDDGNRESVTGKGNKGKGK
jgi:hypothetical protein